MTVMDSPIMGLALLVAAALGWWLGARRTGSRHAAAPLAEYWPGFTSRHRLERIALAMNLRIQLIDRELMYVDALGRARPDETHPEAVIGATIGDGMTPEQAAPHLDAARRALAGETLSYLWDWTVPGEPVRWHRTIVSPVGLDQDDITGFISATHDISDEVAARAQVERDQWRFRTAFRASPVAGLLSRLDNGLILDANEAFFALTGFTRDEVIGRTATDLRLWADDLRDRISGILRERGSLLNLDSTIRMKSGETRITLTSLQIAELDGTACVMRTDYDITERRRARNALAASEERFRSLVASLDELVLEFDGDARIREVHGGTGLLDPRHAGRVSGLTLPDALGIDEPAGHRDACRRALAGERAMYEMELARPEGTRFLQAMVSPVRGPGGEVAGLVLVGRDMTAARRAEIELRQRDARLRDVARVESIGRLAGGVAHDFNNLLTIINGYAAVLLSEGGLREDDARKVGEIAKAGQRAAALTGQLLAFGRRQPLQPRDADLNHIVTDMLSMLQRLIGEHITLSTRLDAGLGRVRVDPGQLGQVIMNLVVNARDAMPSGGQLIIETGNIEVTEAYTRWHVGLRPGGFVRVMISDTGTGMDRETQSRAFEPFFTTKEFGKGTGLGLATVHGIISQSGGDILLYSEPGHGTTFKIFIPRVDTPGPGTGPAAPTGAGESLRGHETILVAEDEPVIRGLVRQWLEQQGYAVLEAVDGHQALDLIGQHGGHIHLLVSDIVMPRLSGTELARRVAALHPGLKVLLTSGYSHSLLEELGGWNPDRAFLSKPFQPVDLLREVRRLLDAAPAT